MAQAIHTSANTAACAVLLAGTALLPASARVPAWGVLDVVLFLLALGLGLVLLLSIPWVYAVARRLASGTDSPAW